MALFTKESPVQSQPRTQPRPRLRPDGSPKPLPFDAPRPFTAAAARVNVTEKRDVEMLARRASSAAGQWQADAFEYYDHIGEVKFAFNLFANVASRARLYPAVNVGGSKPPAALAAVDDLTPRIATAAQGALDRLFAGASPATIIRMMALNFSIAGESYLVQIPKMLGSGTPERWRIVSSQELQVTNSSLALRPTRDSRPGDYVELPPRTFVGRIWREHPMFSGEPDSSLLGVLDPCLPAGTLVYTPDGPLPIETIRPGQQVYSVSGAESAPTVTTSTVTAAARTGTRQTYEITTHGGRRIRATDNHRFLVLVHDTPGKGHNREYRLEYRRTDELAPGDAVVALDHVRPDPDLEPKSYLQDGTEITPEVAWFLGVYAGDGYSDQNSVCVSCKDTPNNRAQRSEMASVLESVWGLSMRPTPDGRVVRWHSRSLVKALRATELGTIAPYKRVPSAVWEGGPKIWASFLDGFLRTDAYRSSTFDGYALSSTSFGMLRDLQAMARYLGMQTSQVRLGRPAGTHVPTPSPYQPSQTRDLFTMELYTRSPRSGRSLIDNRAGLSTMFADQQLSLATVRSITPNNELEDVYDLSVPETSNFIAEGLVTHNCSELLLLNRTFRATARSRLNAGAFYLPDGLAASSDTFSSDVSTHPDDGDDSAPEHGEEEDPFEQELLDAMTAPILDPESAAAVVPMLIRGPAELGEKIKQFKFERSFDPALATRADRVLDRILQGLDVPKEVVAGIAEVRYANATAISDSLYQAHVEPMLLLICDSLTEVYLRPALEALGFTAEQARRLVVWYDPSGITTRPDRAADADSGYDRFLVSGDSWRSSHGFSDADTPKPDEIAYRLLVEKGQVPPELTELLLKKFAPELMEAIRNEQLQDAQSGLPPEVAQALGTAPSNAPAPPSGPMPPTATGGGPL